MGTRIDVKDVMELQVKQFWKICNEMFRDKSFAWQLCHNSFSCLERILQSFSRF